MVNSTHVNKYAKGLFNISIENNSSGDVRDGLNSIIKISKSIPELNHLLFTKNTSRADKKIILSNVLKGKVNPLALELFIILIENDEVPLLADITHRYNHLININATELNVSITSNVELSENKAPKVSMLLPLTPLSVLNLVFTTDVPSFALDST